MQQLTGLDAAFLSLDTATSTGHVGGVHLLSGEPEPGAEPLTLASLTELVRNRLHLVPPMRRRVVEVPLGIDQPYWIEDPAFDLEFHVRELALPAPGSMHQLSEQVARIHSRPLDRARPLWEIYLIHGVEGGRLALYAKLHHAMIDGVAGQEVSAALMDLSPQGRTVEPEQQAWRPDQRPGTLPLLTRSLLSLAAQPRRFVRLGADLVRSSPGLLSTVVAPRLPALGRLIGEDADVLFRTPVRAPATPFNRTVTPHRRVALRTVPLDAVKAVKNAMGVTVNDVVMAMCAGALRHWLTDHDCLPEGPLVAAVPVSVRGGSGGFGNRVSLMLATLPTDAADCAERLRVAHEATLQAKMEHQALPADLLADAYSFAMPALLGLATRANARLRLMERVGLFNLFISNIPGPAVPLYVGGHRVLASFPVSAITDGQGLNITVVSYLGGLNFGLIADRQLVPDLDVLADYLVDELATLTALVGTAGASTSTKSDDGSRAAAPPTQAPRATASRTAPARKAPARTSSRRGQVVPPRD